MLEKLLQKKKMNLEKWNYIFWLRWLLSAMIQSSIQISKVFSIFDQFLTILFPILTWKWALLFNKWWFWNSKQCLFLSVFSKSHYSQQNIQFYYMSLNCQKFSKTKESIPRSLQVPIYDKNLQMKHFFFVTLSTLRSLLIFF